MEKKLENEMDTGFRVDEGIQGPSSQVLRP